MNERTDYEHLERDLDGFNYWFTNRDVKYIGADAPKELKDFREWFYHEEEKYRETSLYYKGTALYFTYKGIKYEIHWTFYGSDLIKDARTKLRELGAVNLQCNLGELD